MADIKISELTQAESLSTSDLLESAVPYNGGFLSRRMSLAQLSNYLENYVQHQALTTTAKTIVSAINEVLGDLANYYYKKTETYSKTEVDTLIAGVSGLHFEVVQQLPTSDIDMNTIYLVPKQDSGQQDVYDEFICLDNTTTPATWEKIGTTEIDLSDYVTDTELETILNDYVTTSGLNTILANYATTSAMTTALADKVDKVSGKGLSTEDYTTAEKTKVNGLATVATSGSYNDLSNKPTIPDELADLTDDSTHRLVSDTEKSTWNGKAELTDVDKAELNTWNLLRQPYFHGSGTSSGTTRTVNADGSVTFTGTATANFNFNFKRYTQEWKLPKGKYRIIGCPVGGSDTTYFLRVQKYTTSLATLATDYGYGAEFTLTEETTMHIVASIISGYAIQDSLTFTPYLIPVDKVAWNDYAEYGVKNLIPYPWYSVNGRENRGITFTFNEEGYIALSGTASTTQQPYFSYSLRTATGITTGKTIKVKSGKRYTLSIDRTDDRLWAIVYIGDSTGTAVSVATRAVFEDGATRNTTSEYVSMNYSSKLHTSVTFEIVTEGEYYLQVDLRVNANSGQYDPTLAKGRVMLRDANISDDTWANYASSNFTLTRKKADYSQITTVETSDVASKAYTVGDYMIWRGGFYVVRADIASGDAITANTNVESTDIGIELKKSIEWKNATGGTIPESGSSNKVYIASKYAKELYISQIFLLNTTLGINVAGYCSLTVPLPEDSASNYYVYFFRGDTDNKLYDGRLLIKRDSTGVYGYVSQVFQDGVNLGASGFTATLYVYEKS